MKSIDSEIHELEKKIKKINTQKNLSRKEAIKLKKHFEKLAHLELLRQYLLKNGFKHVNDHNDKGISPLANAIYLKQPEMVALLLQHPKIKINATDKLGRTAVFWAATNGSFESLKLLSEKGADLTIANKKGRTPLFQAIKNKFNRIAHHIIHKVTGLSMYEELDYGQNPIHAICTSSAKAKDKIAMLELLKENKVDLNTYNANHETPLMLASLQGNIEVIEWLLEAGADPTLQDREKQIFLHYVADHKKKAVCEAIKKHQLNSDFLNEVDIVKEYSHVLGIGSFLKLGTRLGLGGIVSIPLSENKKVPIYTESWDSFKSYRVLSNEISQYTERNKKPDADLLSVKEAYKTTYDNMEYLNSNPTKHATVIKNLMAQYQSGKPIVLPVGTETHAVGFAIYKDKLIYTDRYLQTGKRFKDCTMVYQLDDSSPEKIKRLLNDFNRTFESMDDINETLNEYVDRNNPIVYTGDKAQSHGTCTYSNPRSNMEGLLAVLKADTAPSSSSIPHDKIIEACPVAKKTYQEFLFDGRMNKAISLGKEVIKAEKSKDYQRADMFYDLIESYIKGHSNQSKNKGTDWQNSLVLYQALPIRLKKQFDKNNGHLSKKLMRSWRTEQATTQMKNERSARRKAICYQKNPIAKQKAQEQPAVRYERSKKR